MKPSTSGRRGVTMTRKYNGKPTAKSLPEFDFDNLPEKLYGDPVPVVGLPVTSFTPDTSNASGNRSAPLFSKDRKFDAQNHDWKQHGRQLSCATCPENSKHGTIIPAGLMLMGERGKWELVPEGGIKRG